MRVLYSSRFEIPEAEHGSPATQGVCERAKPTVHTDYGIALLLVLFLFSNWGWAADYYVDSQNGDDSFAGTSPEKAWRSLDAVNRNPLKPGDRVLFRRGGAWRGQLRPQSGNEGAPIVYGAYGDSQKEKPSLLGSVSLAKRDDWIDEGQNIWSTRPDVVRVGKKVEPFETLTWGLHKEGTAAASMKIAKPDRPNAVGLKEYRISCSSPGDAPNRIQFILHGFKVEADRHYVFRFASKSTKPFTLLSISFSEPGAPWGSLGSAKTRPGEFGTDWKEHEILFHCNRSCDDARFTLSLGKAIPEGVEFSVIPVSLHEATVESNGIHVDVGNIILDGKKAGFKKWTKDDLKDFDDFWYDIQSSRVYYLSNGNPATRYSNIEAALYRHVVDHGNTRYVEFVDLDVRYGAAHGFGGTKARNVVYRNLDVSWIGGADQYREGGAGRRVRFGNGIEFWSDASDCLVEGCRLWEIYDAALTNQGAGKNVERNLAYRNNRIWNCEYSFEYWNREEESVTENIVFENNICLDAGYGWGYVQRPNKNGRHLMFYRNPAKTLNFVIRNNVFCNARDSLIRIDTDWRSGLMMEGNIYWQPPGKELAYWLTKKRFTIEQFAEYQNELGLDKTSKIEKYTE